MNPSFEHADQFTIADYKEYLAGECPHLKVKVLETGRYRKNGGVNWEEVATRLASYDQLTGRMAICVELKGTTKIAGKLMNHAVSIFLDPDKKRVIVHDPLRSKIEPGLMSAVQSAFGKYRIDVDATIQQNLGEQSCVGIAIVNSVAFCKAASLDGFKLPNRAALKNQWPGFVAKIEIIRQRQAEQFQRDVEQFSGSVRLL